MLDFAFEKEERAALEVLGAGGTVDQAYLAG